MNAPISGGYTLIVSHWYEILSRVDGLEKPSPWDSLDHGMLTFQGDNFYKQAPSILLYGG